MRACSHIGFLASWIFLLGTGVLLGQSEDPCLNALAQHRPAETINHLQALQDSVMELQKKRRFVEALEALAPYVEVSKEVFEVETPCTLAALQHQAHLYFELEEFVQARSLQEFILDTSIRILGADSELTLEIEQSLATTLYELGDTYGALERTQHVFAKRSDLLGQEHPDTIQSQFNLGLLLLDLGRNREAQKALVQTVHHSHESLGAHHPQTLNAESQLGLVQGQLGDLRSAKGQLTNTFSTSQSVLGAEHPVTLETLQQLAHVLSELGELQEAIRHQQHILNSQTRTFGEDHRYTLISKSNLAKYYLLSGKPAEAEQLFRESLKVQEHKFGIYHPIRLGSLNNLGVTLQARGNFQEAKQLYEQILEIGPKVLGPSHPNLLLTASHLASIHRRLGNLEAAKQLDEQTLESRRRLQGAEHRVTLRAHSNLAATLLTLGEFELARSHYEFIFETRRSHLGPENRETLAAALGLSDALKALGQLEESRRISERNLEISRRSLGRGHPDTLRVQANLADTFYLLGDSEEAKKQYEDILRIRRLRHEADYRPSTEDEAQEFFGLGQSLKSLGETKDAYQALVRGLGALEAQTLTLDLSESVKTRYISNFGTFYQQAISVGLAARRPSSALHILERYRTQSLLSLLRWRHSDAELDIPQDLRSELHYLARRYDRLTRAQDRIYPDQNAEYISEQETIRRRREVIQGKIIAARRAQGDLPQPLETRDIQNLLDRGTLLLSFAVGEETSHLFALTSGSLEAVQLDVTSDVLSTQVDRLRALDLEGDTSKGRQALSAWLYERLLAPVASQLKDAQRVLILPDGPLNFLPFAALTRPAPEDPRGWQYLAEWKPIHSVQSATVYGELLAQRPTGPSEERPWQWVGFGNPVYPTVADLDASSFPNAVRSTTERGIWDGLTPLPHTEREIRGIAQLFPEDRIQPLLHQEATEDRARQVLGEASIVHFAAHGLADPDYPMDSFLALTLNDSDTNAEHNGLLQAWEIADHLHLDADLVVLSACVTALGPNRGGEGLISLSRAFQIAGARSVLASLWSVNDLSTSELMLRFYQHLQTGESKDRALQLAQQELIQGPVKVTLEDGSVVERDFSNPYHWAAFQLIGDWR